MRSTLPFIAIASAALIGFPRGASAASGDVLNLQWRDGMLQVSGGRLTVPVSIWYLEAYCRPGSTDRAWDETVVGHRTEQVEADPGGGRIRLRDTLRDGVIVEHTLTARRDEVDFRLEAHNPTGVRSEAHWAQPCLRVDKFAGAPGDDFRATVPVYSRKCFIFVNDRMMRLPIEPWALAARYTPGQVWAAPGVSRDDVNPRPLSQLVPSNGLVGCFSEDEKTIVATVWEPWQELFLGVIGCIHSDFRLGGLDPGERKIVRGKLYVVEADVPGLLRRYRGDFPVTKRGP